MLLKIWYAAILVDILVGIKHKMAELRGKELTYLGVVSNANIFHANNSERVEINKIYGMQMYFSGKSLVL